MSASDNVTNALRQKYRGLRHLLSANTEALEMMADIEADLLHVLPSECGFRESITALIDRTLLLIQDLFLLSGGRYGELFEIHRMIESDIRHYLRSRSSQETQNLFLLIRDVSAQLLQEVGGKAANLSEVARIMDSAVPPGFIITTAAYRHFLEANDLNDPIRRLLQDINLISDPHLFSSRTEEMRNLIRRGSIPDDILEAIENGQRNVAPSASLWAVRSSALGEDGRWSYAGQFDTFLNVPVAGLPDAYKDVLASRYSDRAIQYRIDAAAAEVDSPMAVLFMPMVDARAAGVIYTRDPGNEGADRMLINGVRGLAENMVQGRAAADTLWVSRKETGEILDQHPASSSVLGSRQDALLSPAEVKTLVESALKLENHFGRPQDIEWAFDTKGNLAILQTRELKLAEGPLPPVPTSALPAPLLSGGTTIFPGRTVGNAWIMRPGRSLDSVPEAALMVVDLPSPELAIVLTKIAGLIATYGNPAAHSATLIRESGVPSIFGMANATTVIKEGQPLSLDATHRALYDGVLWPNVQDRVRLRVRHPLRPKTTGFLNERILTLNLMDPQSASFRPKSCRTIHDIVRFVHEKAVETMFDMGDAQVRKSAQAARMLKTDKPINLRVLNLGGGMDPSVGEKTQIAPEEIISLPFQALWRGITTPGIAWTGRNRIDAAGFASVLANSLFQQGGTARRLGDLNYLMVGADYLCLNARLAYHFAMVDAMVSDAAENNYVNFRFRGGGAGVERRFLRAQFLAQVLLRSSFGVNQQGDLVTAWLRRYPMSASEEGLILIGRLMGCARQLDMILNSATDVREYVERFLQGEYEAFA